MGMDREDMMGRVAGGEHLTAAEEDRLVETRDLIQLGMLASEARARLHGTTGTFVRVQEVLVDEAASAAIPAEAGEVRLVGPVRTLDHYCRAVAALRARTEVPVTGCALDQLAGAAGHDLPAWLAALREAGLAAVAHAQTDRLEQAWLAAVAQAGLTVQSVSFGVTLEAQALLAVLRAVRGLQEATGVITALQPLPVDASGPEPSTGYDDMHAVALSRVLVPGVPHVQMSWARAGAKLAQAGLLFGADDVTDVPAEDAMPHGPRRAIVEEVRRNFLAVALIPVERDARYRVRALQT
jgi:2-iminoacetate synthase ThiH